MLFQLEIIETVQTSIHQSTRAGGSHLRNFQLLIAMTEMKTLEKMLQLMDNNAADKPAKDVISKEVTGHVKRFDSICPSPVTSHLLCSVLL